MSKIPSTIAEGLEQLNEGFGIFDDQLNLVLCNRNFQELRNYPSDLCLPGSPLEGMMRFNAERGDFGIGDVGVQIEQRMSDIRKRKSRLVERELADGRLLQIRYQHLEGGGLTVTYEDKTEQNRAQRELAKSEERYALVAEAAEEALYEWNIETGEMYFSERLKGLLGLRPEQKDLGQKSWEDKIHPDDVERYRQTLASHMSGELHRWECEYRFSVGKDRYRWLSDHGTSVRNQKGEAIRMVAAISDVTERVERDAALAANEERLELVSRATSDGLYDWNVAIDKLFVSDRLNQLFGFRRGEIGSRIWAERVHQDDLPHYIQSVREHFKGKTNSLECEYRITDKAGDYRWVRDHGIGVRNDVGRVVRLVGAVRDITEIKQAEARLQASVEAMNEGFLMCDADDRVRMWNSRFIEIFSEASQSDIGEIVSVGRRFSDMITDGYNRGQWKPHPGGLKSWLAERLESRKKLSHNVEMQLANDRWVQVNEHRLPDGGRVSIYNDITNIKVREQESAAARARFEDAIEALSSGFVLFDADDRIVVSNTKYREYFARLADMAVPGTKFEDLISVALQRGLFPDSEGQPDEWLAELTKKRGSASGVREQYLEGGLWLQISDHRTKEGGIVSIYTDVTELKNRETELREQSAILEATLENMGQAISMVDKDLNVVIFNKKFLEYFDFPGEDFKRGFHMSQAFRLNAQRGEYGEGDVEQQVQERLELSAKFQAHHFERERPDGITLEIVGNPVDTGGFVTTYTDITARKEAENAILDREKRLNRALEEQHAVLEAIEYGIMFMGPDLKARLINRALGDIWGVPQDFIDTKPTMQELLEYNRSSGLYEVSDDDWDNWVEERLAAVRTGEIKPIELQLANGKVVQHQCIALPDGGRMLTYFDITDLKKREAELIEAKNEAEQTLLKLQATQERLIQSEKMASLGQLTAGIAHEIKNPLNFVNNFAGLSREMMDDLAEVLEDVVVSLGDEDREEFDDLFQTIAGNLDKINSHGRRADAIVKNMLSHSREGPGEVQTTDVNNVVEEAINLAFHGARADNPDMNISIVRNFTDLDTNIDCYPQELQRVFLNLIANGIYAANDRAASTNDFEPELTVKTEVLEDQVCVRVRDNGSGVSAEIQDKIFTPFFTTKPPGEGTGLGLSLSYDIIVKQHAGTMSVDSEKGSFTEFVVALPRTVASPDLEGATRR